MLMLIFHIGTERYALNSESVVEVVPLVVFKQIPGAPEYVAGLMQYRGRIVPVIDLCCLAGGGRCRRHYSTRIMLVEYGAGRGRPQLLGLLAERVTETLTVAPADLAAMNVRVKESPYLGRVLQDAHGMITCLNVAELLPPPVQEMLYPEHESEPEHGAADH